VISGFLPEEKEEYLKEATPDHAVDPSAGYLAGFTEEEARREAARCLHCDCRKQDDCKLRIHSEVYYSDRKRFAGSARRPVTRNVQHDLVVYEPGKCIRCGRCVSITAMRKESLGLTFVGRGFDVRVAAPFGEALGNALAETAVECAEACPTGAISMKS
jgi:predicted molibdopterin-dependent oxidoreductase YjgC